MLYQFTPYPIEHLFLHHKKVGSPEDPITSPKNQSFYKFYVKSILSAYQFNYNYNRPIFCACLASTIGYNALVFALADGDFKKFAFFALLSYAALVFMEGIEYIEHYGLVYRGIKGANGNTLEDKVTEICSWNTSENGVQNWLIFRYQRHSDHHMNAYKIYSSLDLT